MDRLIEAAGNDRVADAIRVATATGLRRGELFGLTWADVDFERRIIHLRRSNYAAEIAETKSEAGERTVPLFESVRKVLATRKLRVAAQFTSADDCVFASQVGTALDPVKTPGQTFMTRLTPGEIEYLDWLEQERDATTSAASGSPVVARTQKGRPAGPPFLSRR